MYFLNCKPTEPGHQKQRVKVLAAILNSFHFVSVEGDTKSKLNVYFVFFKFWNFQNNVEFIKWSKHFVLIFYLMPSMTSWLWKCCFIFVQKLIILSTKKSNFFFERKVDLKWQLFNLYYFRWRRKSWCDPDCEHAVDKDAVAEGRRRNWLRSLRSNFEDPHALSDQAEDEHLYTSGSNVGKTKVIRW